MKNSQSLQSFIYPDKNNLCAIIVTYFPSPNIFKNIEIILRQTNSVIIVDNSATETVKNSLFDLKKLGNVQIIFNQHNYGIAQALNIGIVKAKQQESKWVITFDQDTQPELFMVDTLIKICYLIEEPHKIGLIGSNYIDANTQIADIVLEEGVISWKEKKTVITSGSMMPLSIFFQIGLFKENFFIDCVDHEYCLRARQYKLKIYFALKPLMRHSIGKATFHYFLGIPWFKIKISNHQPFRWYFITKNMLTLTVEYFFKEPCWILWNLFRLLGLITLMCIFERQRGKKIYFICLGVKDWICSGKRNISDVRSL